MPKTQFIQYSLNGGEFSPLLYGRADLAKYQRGLKQGRNVFTIIQGGVKRRDGMRYVASTKSGGAARLVPFIFDKATAYVLEFSAGFIRFYANGGQVLSGGLPYEIASPYTAADLADIHYAQSATELYLVHPKHAPRILTREAETGWELDVFEPSSYFETVPFARLGVLAGTTLSLSAATGTITCTAGSASFTNGDGTASGVSATYILGGTGRGRITGFTSTTVVTAEVEATFDATSYAAAQWRIFGDQALQVITPSAAGKRGQAISLTAGAALFHPNSYATSDKGRLMEINGGLVKITGVGSTTLADAIVIRDLITAVTTQQGGYIWFEPLWGDWGFRGTNFGNVDHAQYPRAVGFYQQRLVFAGVPSNPNSLFCSAIGDPFDFHVGTLNSSAATFDLAEEQNTIEHLAPMRQLFPLTAGSEWTVQGAADLALGPTSVEARRQTTYGASNVRPVQIGNELVFIQRSGKKVRAIGFSFANDAYQTNDISVLAEHLFAARVADIAYAQEPYSLLWGTMADGELVSGAIEREQDVFGWTPHDTAGDVEFVATIPYSNSDQVWLVVKRTINGVATRYVEYFDSTLTTDAGITGYYGLPTTDKGTNIAIATLTVTSTAHYAFSTTDKGADLSLFGDLVTHVTFGGSTYHSIRGTSGKASGKWYFEVRPSSAGGGFDMASYIGVGAATATVSNYVGQDANGWGYNNAGFKANNAANTAYGATYTEDDVIGVALDRDGGNLTFYKNNVTQGVAFTGLTGTLFPMASLLGLNAQSRAYFDGDDLNYSPPAGYQPWGADADALRTTAGTSSGQRYWEIEVLASRTTGDVVVGIGTSGATVSDYVGADANGYGYRSDANKVNNASASAYGATYTAGDIIGVALEADANTLTFYKNGVSQGSAYTGLTGTYLPMVSLLHSGASVKLKLGPLQWTYAPPAGHSAFATTSWSGLAHLEGKSVDVIGDGVYQGTKTVASGAVTIDAAANEAQFGLHYGVTVQTLTPEIAPGITGTQALATSVNNVWLRVRDSRGAISVNGQPMVLSSAPADASGDFEVSNLGWSEGDGSVLIVQTEPYPLTLLAIIKSLTVNG